MRFHYVSAILLLFLVACASPSGSSSPPDGFQLHTGSDGRVYRLDIRTGKTSMLEGGSYRDVSESTMPKLVVEKVYLGEDGKTMFRYRGEGIFEPWGLEKYRIHDEPKRK